MTMTQRVGTLVAATLLSVAGGLVPMAGAQEAPGTQRPAAKPASGMGEGIKVHGHWTIEVRNPDGSVASVHKFENALVRKTQFSQAHIDTGDSALRLMLLGFSQGPPNWDIALADGTNAGVRGWFRGGPCEGTFAEAAAGVCIARATAAVSPSGDFQLNANITAGPGAGQDGRRIGVVGTRVWLDGITLAIFTAHELSPALTVTPGQIVQVTVVISFS